ncbi:MAG TPA: HD domain-containing phosphohydrolase [Pirellulales bacterium]|jgi:putative two-component system response regulator|nr:HD domain-containing phosphohydrolase [Pirellulales bacterium]
MSHTPAPEFAPLVAGSPLSTDRAAALLPAVAASSTADADPILDMTIMVLDDEPFNCLMVRKHLRDARYKSIVTLSDASAALDAIRQQRPALLLLDIVMPQITGLEILRLLRTDPGTRHLPVLILTASTEAETRRSALELGATDFLAKPVDPLELVPRVRNALTTKDFQDRLARHAEDLEQIVCRRTAELEASRKEVIHCLARAAEYRDDITGRHVIRVGRFAGIIARALGFRPADAEALELAAQLHDVGKIGIPDAILHEPGKLDPEMFAVMQRHCAFGNRILAPLTEVDSMRLRQHADLGASLLNISSSPIISLAARIAQTHHERWDGTGYPLGLAGNDIPLEGRITAVADVFDALSSARPYKPPIPREKCFAILTEGRGTHFDPTVLDAFFACSAEIIQVQLECMDP